MATHRSRELEGNIEEPRGNGECIANGEGRERDDEESTRKFLSLTEQHT